MSHANRWIGLVLLLTFMGGEAAALTISNVRANSVTTQGAIIRWATDEAAAGRVNCGPSPAYGRTEHETEPTLDHYVFLDGLTPGTTYHFQVQAGATVGADATFTTAPRVEDLWPVVSLSFDDGHISHVTTAFPLMRARDMRGAVNVITDRLANPGKANMTLDHLLFLQKQGWVIDSHSRAHNRDKTLTDDDEVVGSRTYLETHGIKKVSSYRVPGSNHHKAREELAARTYPLRWGNVIGGPPSPRYTTLPLAPGMYAGVPLDARQAATREERIVKYKAAIDEVLTKHLYTHFIFHVIADLDPPGYNYAPDEFEVFLDYLQARGIRVIPPGELLQASQAPATGSTLLFSTSFQDGADAWTPVSGSFKIDDGAYRAQAMDEANRLARTVTGEPTWKDYRVTARLKLDRTANDRADYGVIARYQDKNNYYMVLYKTLAKHCTIEAKINGKLRTLAEAPCDLDPAQWHEFEFTVSGPSLALAIDGKAIVRVDDATLANGAAGLLAFYDEIQCTRFKVTPVTTPEAIHP
jgi:peptidoglycan/xylan/chitin deacetylase (PgdA/CDA1 family)